MKLRLKIFVAFGQVGETAANDIETQFNEWVQQNPNIEILSTQIVGTDTVNGEGVYYSNLYLKIEYLKIEYQEVSRT